MERSLDGLDGAPPSILLLGMRGAGKTTLGRLAAEHLRIPFVDADELFCERHAPDNPKSFVASHGWPAFRQAETELLLELLQLIQEGGKPMLISLGGGIVEEECNRAALIESWCNETQRSILDARKRIAVVHVFREVDKMLLDGRGMPSWGVANGAEVWERRRPWFRECSSHEFVNFTDADYLDSINAESSRAARLRFEAVERDFVSFLIRLLRGYRQSSQPFVPSKNERTYLATLPFEDLRPHVKLLPIITQGVDAIELRADLLRDPIDNIGDTVTEAYENPSLSYLSEQVALIRRHLPAYPIIFTLRTPAQGGRYPYPANAPAEALFTSLHHALKLGCEMIDIEMRLDANRTEKLIADAKGRKTSILLSWRDKRLPREGGFDWSSKEAERLYTEATNMGADIVKIVGTAGQVSDNFALRVFAASIEEQKEDTVETKKDGLAAESLQSRPPLSAYNMGNKGRISRFLNPVLASVTHDITKQLTSKGIIGNPSMTFNEIQRALHLSGLLDKASFLHLYADSKSAEDISSIYRDAFYELGLPYSIKRQEWKGEELQDNVASFRGSLDGDLKGIVVGEGIVLPAGMTRDQNVLTTGICDTIIIERSGALLGCNKLVEGLVQLIKDRISPSISLNQHRSAVVLSSGGCGTEASSALHALQSLGLGSVSEAGIGRDTTMLQNPPSIIINTGKASSVQGSELLLRIMAANKEGGLYISLCGSDDALPTLPSQIASSWQVISHQQVVRQVHALRFHHFTGRRLPPHKATVDSMSM